MRKFSRKKRFKKSSQKSIFTWCKNFHKNFKIEHETENKEKLKFCVIFTHSSSHVNFKVENFKIYLKLILVFRNLFSKFLIFSNIFSFFNNFHLSKVFFSFYFFKFFLIFIIFQKKKYNTFD